MVDDDVYSRTIKVNKVEEFDWQFTNEYLDQGKNKMIKETVNVQDIQAIYLNPKWKTSQVGDCLTFDKRKKKKADKNYDGRAQETEK